MGLTAVPASILARPSRGGATDRIGVIPGTRYRAWMDAELRQAAEAATGFMPEAEGLALCETAEEYAATGPVLEVGSYCGKSAIYLAAGVRAARKFGIRQQVVTVDHHRGSEEHQSGWEYHDPTMVDPAVGRIDTLPRLRATLAAAGIEDDVVAIVGKSADVATAMADPARPAVHRRRPHRRRRPVGLRGLGPLGRARRRPGHPRRLPRPGRRRPGPVQDLPARPGLGRLRGGPPRGLPPHPGTHHHRHRLARQACCACRRPLRGE